MVELTLETPNKPTVEEIIGQVLFKYNVNLKQVTRPNARGVGRRITKAKQEIAYRLYAELKTPQQEIADILNLNAKGTVSSAIRSHAKRNKLRVPSPHNIVLNAVNADLWAIAQHLSNGRGYHDPRDVWELFKRIREYGYRSGYQAGYKKFNRVEEPG